MTEYTADFYDLIRPGVQASANAVVPHFLDGWYGLRDSDSVLDVGCGEGWWALEFSQRTGCTALGIDSSPNGGSAFTATDHARYVAVDLDDGRFDEGRFDLAVCLEVAEHLPPAAETDLVASLVQAAPVVLFSAAVPGQPGAGHVNCQWQEYWAQLFYQQGYWCSDELRWELWNDQRVAWWYRQNMFVAWQPGKLSQPRCKVYSVVHPDFWAVR